MTQHDLPEIVAWEAISRLESNQKLWKVSFLDYGMNFRKLEILVKEQDKIVRVQQHKMRIDI